MPATTIPQSTTTVSVADPNVDDPPSGLVLMTDCLIDRASTVTLHVIDVPETLELGELWAPWSRDYSFPGETTWICSRFNTEPDDQAWRNTFDDDYSRVAVVIPSTSGDGSSSVGYHDFELNQLVDVGGAFEGGSDFSGGVALTYPQFQRGTDAFWYENSGTREVFSVEISNTGSNPTLRGEARPAQGEGCQGGDWIAAPHQDWLVQRCDPLFGRWPITSPSGAYAALYQDPNQTDMRTTGYVEWWASGEPTLEDGSRAETAGRESCFLSAWITEDALLCSELHRIDLDADKATATFGEIIPEIEGRTNFNPVVSPDGTQIAFASCLAEACELFLVPSDGSTEPVRLGAWDSQSYRLLEWR